MDKTLTGTRAPDRIVLVSDSAMARGGATSLVRRSARLLRARGHAVTLLCGEMGQDADDAAGPLAGQGIEVRCLGQGRLLARGTLAAARAGLWNGAAARFLADWIARSDTPGTIYHLHGWAQILSPAAFGALARVAPRTVLHAHDFFLACPNGTYMDYPRAAVCTRVPLSAACLSTNCDKRSAAQKGWRVVRHAVLRRALHNAPWGAIAMIHPGMAEPLRRSGLNSALFHVALNPAEPFTPHRIEAERNRRVAFVGRLDPEKGAGDLAEAAAALGVSVTFVGEGPDEASIRAALPDARITGWQTRDQIGAHLQDVRGLVMPSRLPEPFGLAAAEASLSGLPVILPDISLLSAGLVEAGLGLSYGHRAPDGLRTALAQLRDMPDDAVQGMSLRAVSGAHGIAQSEAGWIDGLEYLYGSIIRGASQVSAA